MNNKDIPCCQVSVDYLEEKKKQYKQLFILSALSNVGKMKNSETFMFWNYETNITLKTPNIWYVVDRTSQLI